MQECARYYAELNKLGANINCVDVGGGLGVDYEGTQSRNFCSMNYSLEDYAQCVVRAFSDICKQHELPQPDIFSESGRALTAHHAVLITNVIETTKVVSFKQEQIPQNNSVAILHTSRENLDRLNSNPASSVLAELYHDVDSNLSEAQSLYLKGDLSLKQRADVENIYFSCCEIIRSKLDPSLKQHHELLELLNDKLADKYFCNFSVFQSIPDAWAIEQVFPIVPIHRLNERPTRRGIIEDITCDSDGRIDHYVDNEGVESSLPLHEKLENEPYLLGMFLVGAYQEILGDMHNLFGDTDSIDVAINQDGSYELSQAKAGDTVDSVLRYVHIDTKELLSLYKEKLDVAIEAGEEKQAMLAELENGLHGYTYLEDE